MSERSAHMLCVAMWVLFPVAPAAEPEAVQLRGNWWRPPAAATRHTTLVAAFDSSEHNDADSARGVRFSGGFGMQADAPGRHGKGTRIGEKGGHLNFRGGSNIQLSHGTLRMQVKGEAWQDSTPRWFFEARAADRIGVQRAPGRLSLTVSESRRPDTAIGRLDLDVGGVSADDWHSIVASWDRRSGRGWIALDGRGISGALAFSADPRPAFAIYLGGGFGARLGGMNEAGLFIDDVVLYDVPLPILEAEPVPLPDDDESFLPVAEIAARKALDFVADLQRWGGWQTIYTWPTLLGSSAQGREHVTFDDYLDNDKGNGSPRTAAVFLYAYEVLGDYRYLDVILRTGEFLLAAQDPRGFWVHGYRMTVHGIKPAASERHIKFQDQVQAHAMFLLGALHRLTGDARYLDAVKKAGEFYLAAQNPNGSWSHHFDAQEGMGKNAVGQPQGGELNDAAMNDAIEVMAYVFHLTGEARYVRAIRRAGDWLIEAQGDSVPLWADQYDGDDNPAWARHFEPPAYGVRATQLACAGLREVYRFSRDPRYLESIRKAVSWAEANCPDGNMWCYVEPGTGRPIASWQRKIHYLDDPKQLAFMKTLPTGRWYLEKTSIARSLRRTLEQAEGDVPRRQALTEEHVRAQLAGLRGQAQHARDTQNEAGIWVVPNVADFMGSLGAGFTAHIPRVFLLLRYAEAARMAKGELTLEDRGGGGMRSAAYTGDDWYDLDWNETTQPAAE